MYRQNTADPPSTTQPSLRVLSAARYLLVGARLYLGAWMLLNGLNHFLPIFPQPMGGGMKSSQLMVTLIETGLFGVVKVTEIFVGLFLLLDLFVPVALVMSLPISVVIWYNAIIGGRTFTVSMASGCLVWTLVLMLAYLRYLLPMMRADSRMGTLADFKRIGEIFSRRDCLATPESKHRMAILIFGALLTATLAYHLHPGTRQEAGSGKTPADIVTEYRKLAHTPGRSDEADAMYLSPELVDAEKRKPYAHASHVDKIQTLATIAQGTMVAVYSRDEETDISAVDIYRIVRNRIVERTTVSSMAGGRE